MKYLVFISMLLFLAPSFIKAQSEIEFQEKYKKHCEGEYLSHLDFNNRFIKMKLVMKKNTTYGIYLFKKEDEEIPELNIINKDYLNLDDFVVETNNEKYKYYKFNVPKAGVYKFIIGSEKDSLNSGIMAIYYQSERKNTKVIIDARN